MPEATRTPEDVAADFWAHYDDPNEDAAEEMGNRRKTGFEAYVEMYGRSLGGSVRRYPRDSDKARIRERQNNCCLYCDQQIGSFMLRRHALVTLRANWDHFIPYAYSLINRVDNWVLACHVCNSIKSSRIFDTVAEAQRVIALRRGELGYELLDRDLQRRLAGVAL